MSIYRVDIEDNKPVSATYIGNVAGNNEFDDEAMEHNSQVKSLLVFGYDEQDSIETANKIINYFL